MIYPEFQNFTVKGKTQPPCPARSWDGWCENIEELEMNKRYVPPPRGEQAELPFDSYIIAYPPILVNTFYQIKYTSEPGKQETLGVVLSVDTRNGSIFE